MSSPVRYAAVLIAISILLTSCSAFRANQRETTVTTVPGTADTALPRQMSFAVNKDSDEVFLASAENFCRRVNSLSAGAFTLTVLRSDNALADFKAGKAGFVLLDHKSASELHPFFDILNEKFRYSGYENFSMTCNSAQVLSSLSDYSSTKVFAAFYTGSDAFLSRAPLDGILTAGRDRGEDSGEPVAAAIVKDSGFTGDADDRLTAFPDVVVSTVASLDSRLEAFRSENMPVFIELSFSELHGTPLPQLSLPVSEAPAPAASDGFSDSDGIPADDVFVEEDMTLTRTFHNIRPAWLIIEPELYESFSPLTRAAVEEAAAYMTGDIDNAYLNLEQEIIDMLESADFVISADFKTTRSRFLRERDALLIDIPVQESRFRELLRKLR